MFEFLNKPYPFDTDLRYSLKFGFGMMIGVFLFILFFKPLELTNDNIDSYLLTVAGFAGISLLLFSLLKILMPMIFRGLFRVESWDLKRELLIQFLFWVLNSVAFSFYLAYVGNVPLTMFLAFKLVLISLAIPVIMMLVNEIKILRVHLAEQQLLTRNLSAEVDEVKNQDSGPLELFSENRGEKLLIEPEDLILVRSAENYVEVVYHDDASVQKRLLRTTLKSIEDQLRLYPEMIRCHRTCIVNTETVEKLHRSAQGIKLIISGCDEDVPVSRQYLMGVKAALE